MGKETEATPEGTKALRAAGKWKTGLRNKARLREIPAEGKTLQMTFEQHTGWGFNTRRAKNLPPTTFDSPKTWPLIAYC